MCWILWSELLLLEADVCVCKVPYGMPLRSDSGVYDAQAFRDRVSMAAAVAKCKP